MLFFNNFGLFRTFLNPLSVHKSLKNMSIKIRIKISVINHYSANVYCCQYILLKMSHSDPVSSLIQFDFTQISGLNGHKLSVNILLNHKENKEKNELVEKQGDILQIYFFKINSERKLNYY